MQSILPYFYTRRYPSSFLFCFFIYFVRNEQNRTEQKYKERKQVTKITRTYDMNKTGSARKLENFSQMQRMICNFCVKNLWVCSMKVSGKFPGNI